MIQSVIQYIKSQLHAGYFVRDTRRRTRDYALIGRDLTPHAGFGHVIPKPSWHTDRRQQPIGDERGARRPCLRVSHLIVASDLGNSGLFHKSSSELEPVGGGWGERGGAGGEGRVGVRRPGWRLGARGRRPPAG